MMTLACQRLFQEINEISSLPANSLAGRQVIFGLSLLHMLA